VQEGAGGAGWCWRVPEGAEGLQKSTGWCRCVQVGAGEAGGHRTAQEDVGRCMGMLEVAGGYTRVTEGTGSSEECGGVQEGAGGYRTAQECAEGAGGYRRVHEYTGGTEGHIAGGCWMAQTGAGGFRR
jgi:hypothetical protein